jgi:hypothetical protein
MSGDATKVPHVSLPIFLRLERIHKLGVRKNLFKFSILGRTKEADAFWLGTEIRFMIIQSLDNVCTGALAILH